MSIYASPEYILDCEITKCPTVLMSIPERREREKKIMSDQCFTLEEVAKHNGVGDAGTWMIIKNVVYDLTDYLDKVSLPYKS